MKYEAKMPSVDGHEGPPHGPPRTAFASRHGECVGWENGKVKHLSITWKDYSSITNSTTHPSLPTCVLAFYTRKHGKGQGNENK